MESHLKQPKFGVPIRIAIVNGNTLLGLVFVQLGQRVRDLLCEKEAFLPVRSRSGTMLVNKANISHVDILSLGDISEQPDLFPEIDLDYLTHNRW